MSITLCACCYVITVFELVAKVTPNKLIGLVKDAGIYYKMLSILSIALSISVDTSFIYSSYVFIIFNLYLS